MPEWPSENSPRVSPALPSYRNTLPSDPTLAKWSPPGAYRTSWTNLVCVLIVYGPRARAIWGQPRTSETTVTRNENAVAMMMMGFEGGGRGAYLIVPKGNA